MGIDSFINICCQEDALNLLSDLTPLVCAPQNGCTDGWVNFMNNVFWLFKSNVTKIATKVTPKRAVFECRIFWVWYQYTWKVLIKHLIAQPLSNKKMGSFELGSSSTRTRKSMTQYMDGRISHAIIHCLSLFPHNRRRVSLLVHFHPMEQHRETN